MSNKKILLIGGHDEFVLHAAVRAIGIDSAPHKNVMVAPHVFLGLNAIGRMEVMEGFYTGAKIRRLLPIETFRLQGYSDEFFYKCQAVNSDTRLYQQAGNTITVSVIQAIIKNLLHILK